MYMYSKRKRIYIAMQFMYIHTYRSFTAIMTQLKICSFKKKTVSGISYLLQNSISIHFEILLYIICYISFSKYYYENKRILM